MQSRRNFGERVLSNFITNIMAAIFDFNGSGRLGRGINLYQGGGRRSKIRKGGGERNKRFVSLKLKYLKKSTALFPLQCLPKYLFRSTLLRELFILSRQSPLGPFSSSQNFVIRKPR